MLSLLSFSPLLKLVEPGATKGMVIAPDACLNDGLVDVLLVRSDYTADLVKLFQGFHNAVCLLDST